MSIISNEERERLYTRVRHILGAPLRSVELEDEQLDTLLEFSIEDYSQYVQDWLTESQWSNLWGLNVETQSLSRAFMTKSLDYETRYTYAYSKIVGLQAGGDWVLKKDYIQLQAKQQIYEIPAGRELNELLWFTPPEMNNLLFDPWAFGGIAGGGISGPAGYAQVGNVWRVTANSTEGTYYTILTRQNLSDSITTTDSTNAGSLTACNHTDEGKYTVGMPNIILN